jgi:hypothetical protein
MRDAARAARTPAIAAGGCSGAAGALEAQRGVPQ